MTKKLTLIEKANALIKGYSAVSWIKQKIRGLSSLSELRGYLSKKKRAKTKREKLKFKLKKINNEDKKLDARFAKKISRDRKVLKSYLVNKPVLRDKFLGKK